MTSRLGQPTCLLPCSENSRVSHHDVEKPGENAELHWRYLTLYNVLRKCSFLYHKVYFSCFSSNYEGQTQCLEVCVCVRARVHACVQVCVRTCAHTHAYVHGIRKPEDKLRWWCSSHTIQVGWLCVHLGFFEIRSLCFIELTKQRKLAGQSPESLGSASHCLPALGLQVHSTIPVLGFVF